MGTISLTLPQDGDTIEAGDVNTPLNTIKDVINGNLDSDNLASNAVTTAKITNSNVTSQKVSLTYGASTESISGATGASWADIGTGFSITTPVNNCVVWVCFAGLLTVVGATDTARISIGVGGAGQEGVWYSQYTNVASTAGETVPLGFTVPVVVASAGATDITLRGIKVAGTSYTVAGRLSAFVVGA